MVRYNLYLTNHQHRFLRERKKQGGNSSETIRFALDQHIDKLKKELLNVSTSKGGEK